MKMDGPTEKIAKKKTPTELKKVIVDKYVCMIERREQANKKLKNDDRLSVSEAEMGTDRLLLLLRTSLEKKKKK